MQVAGLTAPDKSGNGDVYPKSTCFLTEGREIVRKIKTKAKIEKTNITFRMSKDLIEQFKSICEKQDVSANEVVENMIEQFVSDFR